MRPAPVFPAFGLLFDQMRSSSDDEFVCAFICHEYTSVQSALEYALILDALIIWTGIPLYYSAPDKVNYNPG